jgi:DNA adenine methylase
LAILEEMTYPGGKNGSGVYQTIINRMPPHDVYIEPFLGGGAIMRLKLPARVNIGLDLDADPLAAFGGARSTKARSAMTAALAKKGVAGRRFEFLRGDGLEFLRAYRFLGSELVYCDPPYMRETRGPRDLYRFEMTDSDHAELLRILKRLPCAVMISGYFTRLYAVELRAWHATHYPTMTRGGSERTEWLWSNFPEPVALHDYRYLGSDFRERERIKRKKNRWVNRIRRMPLLERRALLSAIEAAQLGSSIPAMPDLPPSTKMASGPDSGRLAIYVDKVLQQRRK